MGQHKVGEKVKSKRQFAFDRIQQSATRSLAILSHPPDSTAGAMQTLPRSCRALVNLYSAAGNNGHLLDISESN